MSEPAIPDERRQHHGVRAIFPAACEALRPFFEEATRWGGQSHEHLAYRTLKEQFPELGAQESYIVVTTAKRLFAAGKFPPAS
jgi:hypothetical protein